MILYAFCKKCRHKSLSAGEMNNDFFAISICPNGHKQASSLSGDHYEVLYCSGLESYLKGCYSESVMSFAASLERTYEYFIKVSLLKDGVSLKEIEVFWKQISNQSERQLGAFISQYLRITNEIWVVDSEKAGFRNKIIHKGHIAMCEEVEMYATYTTECQVKIINLIIKNFHAEKTSLYLHESTLRERKLKEFSMKQNLESASISRTSMLGMNWQEGYETITFQSALDAYKENFFDLYSKAFTGNS